MENSTPAKNYAEMTFHLKGKQIPTSRESIFIIYVYRVFISYIDAYTSQRPKFGFEFELI